MIAWLAAAALFLLAYLLPFGLAWGQPAEIWSGQRPSRDPCAGWVVGTKDCSLETRVKAVLGIERACDLPELLAASRAWAHHSGPQVLDWVATLLGLANDPTFPVFAQKAHDLDLRWRKAVAACTEGK